MKKELLISILDKLEQIEKQLTHKEKPLMNIEEASEYLQIPKATLYFYTSKAILPYYKLQGKRVYFKVKDLDNFVLNKDSRYSSNQEIESKAIISRLTPLKRTKSREKIIPVQKPSEASAGSRTSPGFLADTYFIIQQYNTDSFYNDVYPSYLNGRTIASKHLPPGVGHVQGLALKLFYFKTSIFI